MRGNKNNCSGKRCVECGGVIQREKDGYSSKPKRGPTIFIHKKCYEALLPKAKDRG